MIPLSSNKKMVLSDKQKEMIDILIGIIHSWKLSNDITSPTVNNDIVEEVQKIDFDSDIKFCQTTDALRTLLHKVINL